MKNNHTHRVIVLFSIMLLSCGAYADNKEFSECKGKQIKNFVLGAITADIPGLIKAIDKDAKCYMLLDPNDPKTKEIIKWNKTVESIREIARRCHNCNI